MRQDKIRPGHWKTQTRGQGKAHTDEWRLWPSTSSIKMVSLCHPIRIRACGNTATRRNAAAKVLCSVQQTPPPTQSTIKVLRHRAWSSVFLENPASSSHWCLSYVSRLLLLGPRKRLGGRPFLRWPRPGGWSLQGPSILSALARTLDRSFLSPFIQFSVLVPFYIFYLIRAVNAGIVLQISGMDEPLEIPVLNDLTMVLGSIAQVQYNTVQTSLGAVRSRAASAFFRTSLANCTVCSSSRGQLAWLSISASLQLFTTM